MARESMASLRAEIKALKAALAAQSAPRAPRASAHIGPSGKPDGRDVPCTVDGCERRFRADGLQHGRVTFETATGGLAWHLRTEHGRTGF